jgi:hypothetical protein
MTDSALEKLCEKRVHETLAKNPKEPKRVLLALLKAVQAALEKEQ